MTEHPIRQELERFSATLDVPAVAGGVVTESDNNFDVVGTCRRNEQEKASLDHQWHIGSCAKSITAALYARLVEQGRADWQASIASLFPDLEDRIHAEWKNRTVDELFYCRAGMRANPTIKSTKARWMDKRSLPVQRTEMAVTAMTPSPKRAGKFLYSNLGYIVIAAAVDRLVGASYEQALDDLLLQPLGITTLGFGPPPHIWGHGAKVRLGSMLLFKGKPMDPKGMRSDNPAVFSAAGTLHVTLADWAKFLRLFISDGGDLLRPESIDVLLSGPGDNPMTKGWGRAELPGVTFGIQGSNTLWSAAALLSENHDRLSLVTCNDGRSRVVFQSATLAAKLLEVGL